MERAASLFVQPHAAQADEAEGETVRTQLQEGRPALLHPRRRSRCD